MRVALALLAVGLPALAAAAPFDGVYVSDPALCTAIAAGDYGQVSATDGVALAPQVGVLGSDFRCNFSVSADDPNAVEAKCLGQDGLFDDAATFEAGEGTLDVVTGLGRMEPAVGGTRLHRCDGVAAEGFPVWDGVEH